MKVFHLNELTPTKLKAMSPKELELLPYEIRDFLLEKISLTGGHLASNLGVVELTIALHYVFNSPKDKIIWDVGHQTYVHKILTGRAGRFDSLRQFDGLAGFPKRAESEHDIYDSGHASTSVSIGLGHAVARDRRGEDNEVVAVIGDGAMTGGVAFEGLNNVASAHTKLIVVLNDNEMSIDQSRGGIARHLSRLRTSQTYLGFKKQLKKTLHGIPHIGDSLYHGFEQLRDSVKYATLDKGAIFEELGFTYFGPVNGHDLPELIGILQQAKDSRQPVLIHVVTQKGKGYINAEKNPSYFHGVGPFDRSTGCAVSLSDEQTYSELFGSHLCQLADQRSDIMAISAAMVDGTGLYDFQKRYPDRIFDVGIAEQHAVSFAAGLAASGFRPTVAIYSTFLQRAYDEILSDICLPGLPVLFMLDRAGIVGADGETHHGLFDLSYLTEMPGMTVLAPKDGPELVAMMDYALTLDHPVAIRYPKGKIWRYPYPEGVSISPIAQGCELLGQPYTGQAGRAVTLLAAGRMVQTALKVQQMLAEKEIASELLNARFIKPVDLKLIIASRQRTGALVTLEDNVLTGGFGASVLTLLTAENKVDGPVLCIGWPDRFIPQGSMAELDAAFGMDAAAIARKVEAFLGR
ncbi:MAG TPA: 1-deoxy-D-xylulose-5-phosphate synthase [Clostridiales bacterium]|jgi:1-deoxy-D-xylulose-5-phosphate synthase|nr:1-deoxy-D-xylulose-5-phosphate synthase [Clostridiales bacterium]